METIDPEGNLQYQEPWYRKLNDPLPFSLRTKFELPDLYSHIEPFPWDASSFHILWNGQYSHISSVWAEVVDEWGGAVAAFGANKLLVITRRKRAFTIDMSNTVPDKNAVFCCAWAINVTSPLEPLVIFSDSRLVQILNVTKRWIVGSLRGHGGPITSIIVQPVHPHIFCTTSRDFTTRIYDLTRSPRQMPTNPIWPPGNKASKGGAPAGIQSSEPEGDPHHIGRCIAILAGGRSGGHQAAVLNAAFHPNLPLIATCGLDRFVKIWKLPQLIWNPEANTDFAREDKPIFSSSRIHRAGVLSVTWMTDDTLLSHCRPVIIPTDKDHSIVNEFPGSIVFWRWLGIHRFFFGQHGFQEHVANSRGCASDYQESTSFTLISEYSLPKKTQDLNVFHPPYQDPVIILSLLNELRIVNVTSFRPRPRQPFPVQVQPQTVKRRRTLDSGEEEESDVYVQQKSEVPYEAPRNILDVPGWSLTTADKVDVVGATMAPEGRTIIAVANQVNPPRSTIWTWQLHTP